MEIGKDSLDRQRLDFIDQNWLQLIQLYLWNKRQESEVFEELEGRAGKDSEDQREVGSMIITALIIHTEFK